MAGSADDVPGRLTRLGLALARPRWALALADDPKESGRAGTDLVVLLMVAVVALHGRDLVMGAWLVSVGERGVGVAVDALARTVTMPLAWLLIGAAVIWVFGGPRRAIGRDFDLACVVVVPMVVLAVASRLVVRTLDLGLSPPWGWVIEGLGFAWASVMITLGVAHARGRAGQAIRAVPAPVRRAGRGGAAGVVAAMALLLAMEVGWVVGHVDWLRPMVMGDEAPAFALPRIEAGGELGAVVESRALTDRVVVLDFWATWCGPCKDALPPLSALARRGKGHVVVLSINLDDPRKARAIFDEGGYATTLVADAGDAADRFGVKTIPHLVVIDRGGIVKMVSRGDGRLQQVIGLAEELGGLHGRR